MDVKEGNIQQVTSLISSELFFVTSPKFGITKIRGPQSHVPKELPLILEALKSRK